MTFRAGRQGGSASAPSAADASAGAPPGASGWLAAVPILTSALFLAPVLVGLAATVAPAFGWLPALGGDALSLDPWRRLLAEPGLVGALTRTVVSGFLATLCAAAIALAFLAAWAGTVLERWVRAALSPVLAMPHAALAIGLAFLLAPSGWFARLLSPWATGWELPPDIALVRDPTGLSLALALATKEVPFLLFMALAAMQQIRVAPTLAVARSLGYGPVAAWIKTVLPPLYRQMRLPLFAVLAYSLSVVDMAMIVGPTTPPTLAVLLLTWFGDPELDRRFVAAAGAVLQTLVVVAAIGLWLAVERAVARLARPVLSDGRRGLGDGLVRAVGAAGPIGLGLLVLAALVGLAIWSLAGSWRWPDPLPGSWRPEVWATALPDLAGPAATALITALASTALALALVIGCLEYEDKRRFRPTQRALWLLYVPLLVPQIGFLFGVQVVLTLLRLDGSWIGLIWAHLLFVLPYVFLALADPWRAFDPRWSAIAGCLGRPAGSRFWRIKLGLLLRPVMVAAAVGFAVSMAQYLPTVFAGAGRLTTLTTEAVALASGSDRRVIAITAFAQAALPMIGFALALAVPAVLYRRRRGMQR